MAQHNVVVTVVDPQGVKHYATMPDSAEISHPGVGGLWTIGCSQVATAWESGDKMEELRGLIESIKGTAGRLKVELRYSVNKKIAEVVETFATKLLPNLNYHRDVCSLCNEALLDETSTG